MQNIKKKLRAWGEAHPLLAGVAATGVLISILKWLFNTTLESAVYDVLKGVFFYLFGKAIAVGDINAIAWFVAGWILPILAAGAVVYATYLYGRQRGNTQGGAAPSTRALHLGVDERHDGISPARLSDGRAAKYAQIVVAAGVDLEDCEVVISRITRVLPGQEEPVFGETLDCAWSFGSQERPFKMNISRGQRRHANTFSVVRTDGDPPKDTVFLQTHPQPIYLAAEMQKPGRYRLSVDVRAKNIDPLPASFLFSWSSFDDVQLGVEATAQDAKIEVPPAHALQELRKEGVHHRNELLQPIEDFDWGRERAAMVEWSDRTVQAMKNAKVPLRLWSKFEILNTWNEPVTIGSPERSAEQIKLEMIWNRKLELLEKVIDEVGELSAVSAHWTD